MALAVKSLKSHFPIFSNWPALVYLDSAATTQKPHSVIQGLTRFYEKENATVHRGLYELSAKATQRYEGVRKKVAELIGASANSIAFTKGTTESINIIAQSFLKKNLNAGDNVVISAMEHHANLIPWQQVCKQNNTSLRIIPVNSAGELVMSELNNLLDKRTKMLAVTHVSNALGTINPVEEIIFKAHKKNIQYSLMPHKAQDIILLMSQNGMLISLHSPHIKCSARPAPVFFIAKKIWPNRWTHTIMVAAASKMFRLRRLNS